MSFAFVSPGYRLAQKSDVSDVSAKLVRTEDRISDLQEQLDRLLLISESMWFLLKDKLKLDDAALIEMMKQVDLRDGKIDGKPTQKPETCAKCGHTVSMRTGKCLYCGTVTEKKTPF